MRPLQRSTHAMGDIPCIVMAALSLLQGAELPARLRHFIEAIRTAMPDILSDACMA